MWFFYKFNDSVLKKLTTKRFSSKMSNNSQVVHYDNQEVIELHGIQRVGSISEQGRNTVNIDVDQSNPQPANQVGNAETLRRDIVLPTEVFRDYHHSTLYYQIEDVPSWLASIFLGLQVYLMMAATTYTGPYLITKAMCMTDDNPDRTKVVQSFMLVSGFVTILQTSFGTRLPIVQGGSAAFLASTEAILELGSWKCPSPELITPDTWKERMREIQGAIAVASIFEVIFGLTGLIGIILRRITPLTVAPSITMIGLSLFGYASWEASKNWITSTVALILMILFSQYLRDVKVPVPFTKSPKRPGPTRFKLFQSLPILLGMFLMWAFCGIGQGFGIIPDNDPSKTDLTVFKKSEWFYVPYPFQWGVPTVSYAAVIGILAAVISGIIESIGDYYACAKIVGAKAPPLHAINRGIFIEGLGCILAGLWGTGSGTTSYSESTGSIGLTQVGSRRIIQIGGVFMVVLSIFGKLNALFISIPAPIVGAFLILAFAMITSVGISNLKGVDLTSSRNLFVFGFSVFFSLTVSQWVKGQLRDNRHFEIIPGAGENFNQMIATLLSTGMFLAGFMGFILDNTVPGTKEERGLIEWNENFGNARPSGSVVDDSYDIPFITFYLQRSELAKWIPILPTFDEDKFKPFFDPIKNVFGKIFRRGNQNIQ